MEPEAAQVDDFAAFDHPGAMPPQHALQAAELLLTLSPELDQALLRLLVGTTPGRRERALATLARELPAEEWTRMLSARPDPRRQQQQPPGGSPMATSKRNLMAPLAE